MSCNQGCYEANIVACESAQIKAGLSPFKEYFVLITKAGNSRIYQRKLSTNSEGILTLTMFPSWLFGSPGSFVNIEIRDGDEYLTKVQLTFSGQQYDCILAKIISIDKEDGDNTSNLIQ